jgi:4-amino-4-deoxy-L-arabinose transferase-like glycosyltransferase
MLDAAPAPDSRRPSLAVLVGCVGLAAVLRFPGLGDQSLWIDEINNLELAPWPQYTNSPLHSLLIDVVRCWWSSDLAGRTISAIAGTLSVGLLLVLGTRLWDRRTGILAALLLAISPLHVWYSREGRGYALFALCSIVSTLYLEVVVRDHERRAALAGYAIATCCGLVSHYAYAAVLIAQTAFFCMHLRDGRLWPLLSVVGAASLAVGLVVAVIVRNLGTMIGSFRGFTWLAVPYTAVVFVAGFGIGPSVEELHRNTTLAALAPYWPEVAAVAAIGLPLVFSGVRALKEAGPWGQYLLLWLVTPVVLGIGAARVTGAAFNVRYVIGSLPAFELLLARGLARQGRVWATVSVCALVAVSAVSIGRDRFDPRRAREDLRAAGRYLQAVAAPADAIVVSATDVSFALPHYYHGNVRIDRIPAAALVSASDATAELRRLGDGGHITWLVLSRDWQDDPRGFLDHELAAERLVPAARFAGVRIYRLGG